MNSPYRLLAPGPVPIPEAVRRALSGPLLHHRTPQFEKILVETWTELKRVFQTSQPVMILTGSGSAAMEAAVTNTISAGDAVVVVVSGKFGERWAEMCERFGANVTRLDVAWGEAVAPERLERALTSDTRAVFTQACETSTATLHPVQELARRVRQRAPEALIAVDAITAVGCLELPMDAWGLDVVIGGSQKAFMIPPGLSFIALSERAWEAQKRSRVPKFYFDLAAERKANEKNENHFTIPTPLVSSLHVVLRQIRARGLDVVQARCQLLAAVTREAGAALGLDTFSKSPSPSVTALEIADSAKVRDWLEREHNITVMGGQDQLKGKVLRIGHMGDVRDDDMLALFGALAQHQKRELDSAHFAKRLQTAPALF